MLSLTGAMTALVTPFGDDGMIDEAALRALVEFQIEGRIDGLVACGTTGESATLSKEEKLAVMRIVVEQAAGRVPVVVGTGSNDTRASVEMTRAALALGADACLAVVPYYNKPNQEGLFLHFEAIASVGMPVVLYNVPGRTVISLSAETVGRLAEIDNIVSIKEASGDMRLGTEIMARAGNRLTYLSGDDFSTFPFCAMGGHGCISVVSNVAPGLMSDLVATARASDLNLGRLMHLKANRLGAACFSDANPVPTKVLLSLMGVCGARVRLPHAPASAALVDRLTAVAVAEGLVPSN